MYSFGEKKIGPTHAYTFENCIVVIRMLALILLKITVKAVSLRILAIQAAPDGIRGAKRCTVFNCTSNLHGRTSMAKLNNNFYLHILLYTSFVHVI